MACPVKLLIPIEMGVAINLSPSRSKRKSQSDARHQQTLQGELKNLRLLKISPDTENISISMQNLWARGGFWLDHTEHVHQEHYVYRDQHRVL